MASNFISTNHALAAAHPGDTITMAADFAAATAADAGSWRVGFRLFDPSGAILMDFSSALVALTITPQTYTRAFIIPTTASSGSYHYSTNVKDGAYAWQNTTQTDSPFSVAPLVPPIFAVNKISGDDIGGTVGLPQPTAMVVQVLDGSGNPAVGATVNWTTTAGSLSAASSTTDANGNASVTLTHAATPQTTLVTATAGAFFATFKQTGHMVLYGTHSAFPTLLKPLSAADPLGGGGFIPDDGLTYSLVAGASDEFTGTSLDTTKWWKRYKDNTGSLDHFNSELQRYGDAHVVSNGTLKLTSTPKVPAQTFTAPNGAVFPLYDSQMIRSRTLVKYGYFECRAKQPPGLGMWPAFWVLPQVGAKPEIDIMDDAKNGVNEFWNMSHSAVGTTLAGNGQKVWLDKNKNYQFNVWKAPATLSPTYFPDDFHVWSLLWDTTTATSYIDGQPVTQWDVLWKNDSGVDPGGASVYANLAVGDTWATNNWTVQPATTPQTYEIDYIRVYQRADIAFTAVSPV